MIMMKIMIMMKRMVIMKGGREGTPGGGAGGRKGIQRRPPVGGGLFKNFQGKFFTYLELHLLLLGDDGLEVLPHFCNPNCARCDGDVLLQLSDIDGVIAQVVGVVNLPLHPLLQEPPCQ